MINFIKKIKLSKLKVLSVLVVNIISISIINIYRPTIVNATASKSSQFSAQQLQSASINTPWIPANFVICGIQFAQQLDPNISNLSKYSSDNYYSYNSYSINERFGNGSYYVDASKYVNKLSEGNFLGNVGSIMTLGAPCANQMYQASNSLAEWIKTFSPDGTLSPGLLSANIGRQTGNTWYSPVIPQYPENNTPLVSAVQKVLFEANDLSKLPPGLHSSTIRCNGYTVYGHPFSMSVVVGIEYVALLNSYRQYATVMINQGWNPNYTYFNNCSTALR